MMKQFPMVLGSALLAACSSPPPSVPLRESVVCVEPIVDGQLRCDVSARRAVFERWAKEAIHVPGSTFSVWAPGGEGRAPVRVAEGAVPESWAGDVLASKATLLSTLRTSVLATSVTEPAAPSELDVGAREENVTMVDAHGVAGTSPGGLLPTAQALNALVVCDRSNSTLGVSCDEAALLSVHSGWLERAGSAPGSSLTVWIPGHTRDEAVRAFRFDTPRGSSAQRAAAAVGARTELLAAVSNRSDRAGSAIAETIDAALEDAQAATGPKVLYIASDMRQVTARSLNFERHAPTPPRFLEWLRQESLAVDLSGIDVSVCGLHHRPSGAKGARFNARLDERIRAAWRDAFVAMGARQVELASDCRGRAPVSTGASDVALAKKP
jgi:hypothetical protein